jgi:hypothetical protein
MTLTPHQTHKSAIRRLLQLCCLFVFSFNSAKAQNDSMILTNGNVIVGTIKSMDKGVLTISTDYSKTDFTIKWPSVKEIYSTTRFLITLKDGSRINSPIKSDNSVGKIILSDVEGKKTETSLDDIVFLKGLKSSFKSRLQANIDLGLNVTKANDLVQYSIRSKAGYLADKWNTDIYYNDIRSSQDSVEATKRTEAGASYTYILPRDWFVTAALTTLSNTEQSLDLRLIAKAGVGKYLVHTNKSFFSVGAGISSNNESFTNGNPKRSSWEGYFGTKANLFNIGDLSLQNDIFAYPSLTESGRWRVDFNLDTRYNLPLDFYVSLGLTYNYDNKPAETGKESDYVFVFSIGWKWH